MAGYSQIGEPNYALNPPLLGGAQGSPGYLPLSIPSRIRNYSPYFNPSMYQMPSQGDNSGQHQMNIYLAKNGIGQSGQQSLPGYSEYGFSPEDWDNITRYLSNPLSNQNVAGYMGIVNRLNNVANTNPQFGLWSPQQRQQWSTDMPIRTVSGFGQVPAPILQNWGLAYPYNNASNLR